MAIVSSAVKIYSDSALTQLVATVAGTTSSSQSVNVTGLTSNTTYYAVAEATDSNGLTGYSSARAFTTSASNYVFNGTVTHTNLYSTLAATVGVTCAGATFTECGIQFSTNPHFTGRLITASNTERPADSFTGNVTGFNEHTTYYYRYYATSNEYGTQYYAPVNNTITTTYAEPVLTITASELTDTSVKLTYLYTGNYPIDPTAMVGQMGVSGQQAIQTFDFSRLEAGVPEVFHVTGLTPNTTYWADWNVDFYDGEVTTDITFTTQGSRPVVVITDITNISPTSATVSLTIS